MQKTLAMRRSGKNESDTALSENPLLQTIDDIFVDPKAMWHHK